MIGPHAMSLHRTTLALRGVLRALDLAQARAGQRLRVAGMVTALQRPGTSKGRNGSIYDVIVGSATFEGRLRRQLRS